MPSYYSQGLPADLDAALTVVRQSAQLAFEDARRGRSRFDERRLLIELRIGPEVVEFVRVACIMAERGWLPIGAVESAVDEYRRSLARQLCPDACTNSAWDESFQRETRAVIERSEKWRACRLEIIETASRLAGAAAGKAEVDRRDRVDDFLARCNEEHQGTEKLIRTDIWKAANHKSARQFQYWQRGDRRATAADCENFERVLAMPPRAFIETRNRKQRPSR